MVSTDVQTLGWTSSDFAATFQRMIRDRYVEVGREIARLRKNLGYSQEELAHRAGLASKTVSRIETPGKVLHEPTGATFRKLAEALGVTVEHLRAPLMRNATIVSEPPPPISETGKKVGRRRTDRKPKPRQRPRDAGDGHP